MTQEKQLLLADICSRLSYKVLVLADIDKTFDGGIISRLCSIDIRNDIVKIDNVLTPFNIEEIRPYLRPMSSMTEEEKRELRQISEEYLDDWPTADSSLLKWELDAKVSSIRAAFYNSHHLDWYGLIEKNLALEAPENMYI